MCVKHGHVRVGHLLSDCHVCVYLQELYDSLEKRRPNLFRLASDTDAKENEAMSI